MTTHSKESKMANATLTADDVLRIRALARGGGLNGRSPSAREMAEIYGVGIETIRRILRGETWTWLLQPAPKTDEDAEASLKRALGLLETPPEDVKARAEAMLEEKMKAAEESEAAAKARLFGKA